MIGRLEYGNSFLKLLNSNPDVQADKAAQSAGSQAGAGGLSF